MQPYLEPPRNLLTFDQIVEVLAGTEHTQVAWGMDLLDHDDRFIEDITPWLVLDGSYVKRDINQPIPGTCSFQVTKNLNWGRDRVRPRVTVSAHVREGSTWVDREVEARCGVYLLNTPEITYGDLDVPGSNTYQVEATSKLALLDQPFESAVEINTTDKILDVITFLIAVKDPNSLLLKDGEKQDSTHPTGKSWESRDEVTCLSVINELLESMAYAPLSDDWYGNYIARSIRDVTTRQAEWIYRFDDPDSVIALPLSSTQDFFKLPNKWIFFADDPNNTLPEEGNGQYTVINQSDGPSSIDARQQIVVGKKSLTAIDQESLEALGNKEVSDTVRSAQVLTMPVALNPLHWGTAKYGDIVRVRIPDIQLDSSHEVTAWEMPMDGNDMKLTAQAVFPLQAILGPPEVGQLNAEFSVADGTSSSEKHFTDQSVGAVSWEWDFTDNGSTDSTEQNPVYTYAAAGTYTVRLTVHDAGSGTATVTHTVVVTSVSPPVTQKIKVTMGLQRGAQLPSLDIAQNLGATWVRAGFDMSGFIQNGSTGNPMAGVNWNYNGIQAYYEDAKSRGIKVLATPTYLPGWMNGLYHEIPKVTADIEDWSDAVAAMVAYYDALGLVDAWEIWNEANHGPFNRDPKVSEYRYLLRRCILKMRAEREDVVILNSGPAARTSSANEWVDRWDNGSTPLPYPPAVTDDPNLTSWRVGTSIGTFMDGLFDASTGIVAGSTPGTPYVSHYAMHIYTGKSPWYSTGFENPHCHAFGGLNGAKVAVGNPPFTIWDDIINAREAPGHGKQIWMTEGGWFAGSAELSEQDGATLMTDALLHWGIMQAFLAAGPWIYYESHDRAVYGASNDSHNYYGLYKKNADDSFSKKPTWDVFRQAYLGLPVT